MVSKAQYASMFENITTKQGLPSDYVYACGEDADGYLWVGTNKGLCRFNGKLWEIRNIDNGLPGNYITQIVPDKQYGIWIHIEEKGYYFFNTKSFKIYPIENTKKEKITLFEKPSIDKGIYIRKHKTFYKIYFDTQQDKLQEIKLGDVETDNTIAIPNSDNKVISLSTGTYHNENPKFLSKQINKALVNSWQVFTQNYIAGYKDVYFIDAKEHKKINTEPLFPATTGKMCIMQTNELCYVACSNQGIVELDTFGNLTRYNKNQGMNSLDIQHLYIAKDGTLYVATLGGGINVLYSTQRIKISTEKGPIGDIKINDDFYFAIDKSQLLVCASADRKQSNIPLPYQPTCLYVDKQNIFIGAANGVYTYNYTGTSLVKKQFLASDAVISSITKMENDFYCSSLGKGIAKISNGKLIFYSSKFPFYTIEKLYALHNGFAAISHESGLFITDKNMQLVKQYTTKDGLLSNAVYALFEQKDTLWVGCKSGLSKIISQKPIQNFSYAAGFKGDRIINIGLQYNLFFWVISEKSTQQFVNGSFISLAKNALQVNDNYYTTASYIDPLISEVLIGDNDGLQIIDLDDFQPNPDVVIPTIQNIKIDNRLIDSGSSISLPHSFKRLELKLAPLSGLIFSRNEILYKLNDGEWQKINDTLSIVFNNLRPGNYSLYAKSINAYGIESAVIILKKFTVKKPWWLQGWFLVLAAIGFGLIIYTVVKYFAKQKLAKQLQELKIQQELEVERQRISRDLHDNMGAYTSALIANVQKVKNNQGQTEDLDKMQSNAESILGSLRDTIWVLNNKEISVHELNDQFKNYVFKVLRNFEDISFHAEETITNNKILSSTTALHIHKILQEIIQNIIKHSKATQVQYTVSTTHRVTFSIQDNGIGFAPDKEVFGNGLGNMQWRAKEADMEMQIHSIKGQGTMITLSVS
jgi:signal transduction histidine kinase/ligand-binding sensor domain-containing protein